jgi:diacylglycerol kinase family enzyme
MIDRADPGQPIPVLGVLAESSDLARSFNLPGDLEGAVRHLRGDNTYALDAMKVTVRGAQGAQQTTIAANVLEVGMAAKRTRLDAERRRRLGNAAAFVHFWSAYLTEGPRSVRIQADRREWEGRAFQVIVGNGQFLHGLRVSPRSFPGDRVLDALVYHGPRSDAYRILPRLYRHGDHLPSDTITELRAKIGFRIEANRPMPVSADGAWIGATPVSIQVVPEAVRLKL